MFYLHLLVFLGAIAFIIMDFFDHGKKYFTHWELYAWLFALFTNGFACGAIKYGWNVF